MKELIVERRSAYGETRLYPVNRAATTACNLTRTTTLRAEDVQFWCELGFRIVVTGILPLVYEPLPLNTNANA